MAEDIAGFAERLLTVIDEGRRTATYKLAVLLALIDCCGEGASATGAAPTSIPTRSIARGVASLYWPQLRPFAEHGTLRQITGGRAGILSALAPAFASLPAVGSWAAAEAGLPPEEVGQVLDVVELTVARYPLLRLQTADGVAAPFIYDVAWTESVSLAQLARGAAIEMKPDAGDQLVRLAPLVRPLVELHWVRMVAAINHLTTTEDDLRRHLFGAERVSFPPLLRRSLVELQDGRCFYCGGPLAASNAIDHFIPWSRWPNDAVENLVVAHPSCNSRKSDRLPGIGPLGRWSERLRAHGSDLTSVAVAARWRSDRRRTTALARSVYAHLPPATPLWEGPSQLSPSDAGLIVDLLRGL